MTGSLGDLARPITIVRADFGAHANAIPFLTSAIEELATAMSLMPSAMEDPQFPIRFMMPAIDAAQGRSSSDLHVGDR